MQNKEGYTPKQWAADQAMAWLSAVYHGKTADLEREPSEAFRKQAKRQVAKLHNQLLDKSGLDGLALSED